MILDWGPSALELERRELEKTEPDYEHRIGWNELRKRKKGKALAIYYEFRKGGFRLADKEGYKKERYDYFYDCKKKVEDAYKEYIKNKPVTEEEKFINNCFLYEQKIMLLASRSEEYSIKDVKVNPWENDHSFRIKSSNCEDELDDVINEYEDYLIKNNGFKNPVSGNINYYEGMAYINSVDPEYQKNDELELNSNIINKEKQSELIPDLEQ